MASRDNVAPVDLASRRVPRPTGYEIASWVIAGLLLPAILRLRLLPALLAGLLVFELVHLLAPALQRRLSSQRAKLIAVALLAAAIVGVVVALLFAAATLLHGGETSSLAALFQKMAEVIEGSRSKLPAWLTSYLPTSVINGDDLRQAAVQWLRTHANEIQVFGTEAGRALAHVILGMIIGGIVSLHEAKPVAHPRPLAQALTERARRLGDAFRRVVFAQVRISAINTAFTAIYLAIVLPATGVHLPLTKVLILVTFVVGLLPVIGNLISNTFIVVVSLSYSPAVAVASLCFLVAIHKLEYFLNAKIVGNRISAHAWELLIAMIAMEAAFGIPGVIAAPIYYAYLKDELARRGLV